MPHIITSLCLRDRSCMEVCPVDCIVPGEPISEWPRTYIDPDTCIDCDACVSECPYAAIIPDDAVPAAYTAKGGEFINKVGLNGHYEGTNHHGKQVILESVRQLNNGEIVDLAEDIQLNNDFFKKGPGYNAKEQDQRNKIKEIN